MSPKEFRAWDKERKEWVYFTLDQLAQGSASLIWMHLENWCQWTGLYDKNKTKIWDGDIDKHWGEIEFRSGVYRMGVKDANIIILGTDIASSDIEITGNIYENPELLK